LIKKLNPIKLNKKNKVKAIKIKKLAKKELKLNILVVFSNKK
jgi:hypothetical protein